MATPAPVPSSPRVFAVVPCAGSGSRAGTAVPKQYQPVAGRPMVLHTLAALAGVPRIGLTLVVVAPGDEAHELAPATSGPAGERLAVARCGGATRAASVLGGLQALERLGATAGDWVLVHDAARCLVTPAQIDRLIDACLPDAVGGLLAHPVADTLKREDGGRVGATLPRSGAWLAQTPQMFRLGMLVDALARSGGAVTDEASAIEAMGLKPLLVPGGATNFKVTWPDDFVLAEALLRSRTT